MPGPAAVLSILVTANTGGASASLTRLDRRLKGSAAQSNTTAAAVAGAGKRIGLALGAAGGASLVAAAKFEQAFSEVRKTVDATEAEFGRIEKGLRDMAKEIPVSVTELSNLAGEAGALGIKSKDIVKFTRVAADLGVTTNLSAEESANALARISNIMDTKGKKAFERMASTLVDLGNKGASTEAEIAEMSLRIAGAGETIGLAESEVLGFASALANVGIRAQAGGSSISRVMLDMQSAVAKGGEELDAFAEVAGVSAEQFARQFERDAPAAIQKFVVGLDEIKESGGDVVGTLQTVGLNEIRVRDALLRLGGATGEVTKAQDIANKAWGENNALAEEANKRYKTTASQFEILKNRVFDLGISFGQDLLPQLNAVFKRLGEGDLGGAISAMAELGGRMAMRLAGAIGQAFIESDVLGKLFIGAAAIRLFGGRGALLKAGARMGALLGIGIGTGTAAGLGGGTAAGVAGGAAAGGLAGRLGSVLKNIKFARIGAIGVGLTIGNQILDGITDVVARKGDDLFAALEAQADFPAGFVGDIGGFLDPFQVIFKEAGKGARTLAEDLRKVQESGRQLRTEELDAFARRLAAIPDLSEEAKREFNEFAASQRSGARASDLLASELERVKGRFAGAMNLKDIRRNLTSNLRVMRSNFKGDTDAISSITIANFLRAKEAIEEAIEGGRITSRKGLAFIEQLAKRFDIREIGNQFGDMDQKARKHFAGVNEQAERKLIPTFKDVSVEARKAFGGVSDAAESSERKTTRKMGDMATAVIKSTDRFAGAITSALSFLETETNKALKGLGAKAIDFGTTKQRKRFAGAKRSGGEVIPALRIGGLASVVPGQAPGDRHILSLNGVPVARVESKEGVFVGNRDMMAAAAEMNERFPRAPGFQGGGFPELQPPARSLANRLAGMGFTPTDTRAPRAGSSYHPSGQAIDYGDSINSMERLWGVLRPMTARLAELFGPSRLPGSTLWKFGNAFSSASLQAGHEDHIHVAITEAIGRIAAQIGRIGITGPAGALRDMAQGATDKVRDAANVFLEEQLGATSDFHLGAAGAGPWQAELQRIAQRHGWNAAHWMELVMRESSGDPTARNPSSGAFGLGQFLGATAQAYAPYGALSTDPIRQIQAMARYISDRYGSPSAALSFHDRNNWYREGGLLQLQRGGIARSPRRTINRLLGLLDKPARLKQTLRKLARPKTPLPRLQDLRDLDAAGLLRHADMAEEFASRAGLLSTDHTVAELADPKLRAKFIAQWGKPEVERIMKDFDPSDTVSLFGRHAGSNEAEWIRELLERLASARNAAIVRIRETQEQIASFKTAINAMIQRLRKQLRPRIRSAGRMIVEAQKARRGFAKRVRQLERIKPRNRTRRQKRALAEARRGLEAFGGGGEIMGALRERRTKLVEHERDLLQRRPAHVLAEDSPGRLLVYRDENLERLRATRQGFADSLEEIQGPFGSMAAMRKLPAVGTLGGRIFDAQLNLRRLGENMRPPVSPEPPEPPARDPLRIEELVRFAEAVRFGAFKTDPFGSFAGMFARGGPIAQGMWGIAGEAGPEIVTGPAVVHSNAESRGMLGPIQVIIEDGAVDPDKIRVIAAGEIDVQIRERDRADRDAEWAGVGV